MVTCSRIAHDKHFQLESIKDFLVKGLNFLADSNLGKLNYSQSIICYILHNYNFLFVICIQL